MRNIAISIALLSLGSLCSCATMGAAGAKPRALAATVVSVEEPMQVSSSTPSSRAAQFAVEATCTVLSKGLYRPPAAGSGLSALNSNSDVKLQRITVREDSSGDQHTFVQPIHKQLGSIAPGIHGMYYQGSNGLFVPDGVKLPGTGS